MNTIKFDNSIVLIIDVQEKLANDVFTIKLFE